VDFDTLGAMLGAFLLDEDTMVLTPERYLQRCEPLAAAYAHKLPFTPRSKWSHPDGTHWKLPLWSRLALGIDFLQSLQIAKWLKQKGTKLDPFYASVILLGISSTVDRINSFSIDDEVHGVMDYLLEQGADGAFVTDWLEGTHQFGDELPQIERMLLAKEYAAHVPRWQSELQQVIYDQACELEMKVYLVGGVTRDLLLGRKSRDMDFIVEGSALRLGRALQSAYGGNLVTHVPFGTARWDLGEAIPSIITNTTGLTAEEIASFPASIDLISARTEWYPEEGQLPQVRLDGIELDMQRRDFSVNTLALRIDADGYTLLDACEGLADLDSRTIRVLHARSFIDDPTRLFRAVRYEQRLEFKIHPQTEMWMNSGRMKLAVVSGDRIRNELNLMMSEPSPWRYFVRAEELGLLKAIHPAWADLKGTWQEPLHVVLQEVFPGEWHLDHRLDHLSLRTLMGYAILLQAQTPEEIGAIGERLMFSTDQVSQLSRFVDCMAEKEALRSLSPSEFTFRLEHLHEALLYTLLVLWVDDHELCDKIICLHTKWRKITPCLNGNDLQAMGIPTGPRYAQLLRALRAGRIEGTIHTRDSEIQYVHDLLQEWGEDV
jgi:tRNA nucleotidyltransferase (CCA-adding enzyme)